MAVQFTAIGWTKWLELFVRQGATAHLFAGGPGPGPGRGPGPELSGNGYQPLALISARWELSARGAIVTAQYPELLWRFTAPMAAAGYFVQARDGTLLWWERFEGVPAGPVDLQALRLQLDLDTASEA